MAQLSRIMPAQPDVLHHFRDQTQPAAPTHLHMGCGVLTSLLLHSCTGGGPMAQLLCAQHFSEQTQHLHWAAGQAPGTY